MHTGIIHRPKYPTPQEYQILFWMDVRIVGASETDCWEWGGDRNNYGYGRFSMYNKRVLAHRLSYTWLIGEIPSGLVVDHLCRNRACVNPKHMELVTSAENVRRGEKGKRTHCIRGHLLSGRNLKIRKNGTRFCRECDKIRARQKRSASC